MKRFALIILTLVLIVVFVGCNNTNSNNNNNQGNNNNANKDDFYTDGFKQGTVAFSDMYTDLIRGMHNSLDNVKADKITNTNPYASFDLAGNIDLNGMKYRLDFKFNYNKENRQKLQVNVFLRSLATNDIILGIYYYRGTDATNLYVDLSGNKIKIPLINSEKETIPFTDLDYYFDYADFILRNIISAIDGSLKYEFRLVNGKYERHYKFEMDLPRSLKALSVLLYKDEYKEAFEFLFSNLLGVSISDIKEGRIPASTVSVEFKTVNGYQSQFGGGKINDITIKLNVDESENTNTVFLGEKFYADIVLSKIVTSNTLLTSGIVNEKDLSGYELYKSRLIELNTGIFFDDKNDLYDLILKLRYDGDMPENDSFELTIKKPDKTDAKINMKATNGQLYVAVTDGDTKKEALVEKFDIGSFVLDAEKMVNSRGGVPLIKFIIYFLGSFRITSDTSIQYQFVNQYFCNLIKSDIKEIADLMNNNCNGELYEVMNNAGIDFVDLISTNFTLIIDTENGFISFLDTD